MPTRFRQRGARDPLMAALLWLALAAGLAALALALPPRTFFVGDPGVKLIAARSAIEHPDRPLNVALPAIAGRATSLVDPFFRVHGDHSHAATSELFPLVSAPLIAVFGVRGAFVLPAIGFLLFVAATAWLGMQLDRRRSPSVLVFVAAVCTPLMFYGLEFWEHTPAAGAGALATAVLVTRPRSRRSLLVSGLLFGIAVLFRPEAGWYCAAVLLAMQTSPAPLGSRGALTVLGGIGMITAPLVVYTLVHSGQLFGTHVSANLSTVMIDWPASRLAIAREWFGAPTVFTLATLVLALTLAAVVNRDVRPRGLGPPGSAWVLFLLAVAAVSAEAALQLFPRPNVWAAGPAALLAVAVPPGRPSEGRNFLVSSVVVYAALVLLTAPNDGGGQWGPRYLLLGFVPLTVLIADALTAESSRRVVASAALGVVLVASLWVDRNAYRELRSAKRAYDQVLQFVERESVPEGYVLTDLWWLDQITAALYPRPIMLFTGTAADARAALRALSEAGVREVTIVRTLPVSESDPIASWVDASGFRISDRRDIPERSLTAYRLARAGPSS